MTPKRTLNGPKTSLSYGNELGFTPRPAPRRASPRGATRVGSAGLVLGEAGGFGAVNGYNPQSLENSAGNPVSLERQRGESRLGQEVTALTLTAFALLAPWLARTGLDGVIAYIKSLLSSRIGVRLARG